MRKLKLFMAVFALLLGWSNASAYTESDLTSAGWEEVTSLPTSNDGLSNYFYVIWSTDADLMLAEEQGGSLDGDQQENQLTAVYRTPADPATNNKFVWMLQYNPTNLYGIRNLSNPHLLLQSRGNWPWRVQAAWEREQSKWTQWGFTYADSKWTIQNKLAAGDGGGDDNWIGPWNSGAFQDNMVVAGNAGGNGNPKGSFKIYRISRRAYYNTNVSGATKESPVDVTAWIANADFNQRDFAWVRTQTSVGNQQFGNETMESWNNNNVSVVQNVVNIPNGLYKLTVDMISGNDTKTAYVYARGVEDVNGDVVTAKSSEGNYNTMSNEVAGNTLTADNIRVTGNTVTVGFKDPSGWIVADNFKLYYYGPTVEGEALAFTSGMKVAANQWYCYNVPATGDYRITTTDDLSNISFQANGTTLIQYETSGATTPTDITSLTVGPLYIKATAAANITITPNTYTYNVGDATPSIEDGIYTNNSLTTFTFTFNDAATNDPGASFAILNGSAKASLKKGGVQQAEGTLSLSDKVLTATFNTTLDLSSTYTIEIAAGVVGYDGQETNAAISTTIKTGTIANGDYYFKRNGTETYLTRGGNYGTENVTDKFGISFEAAIQTDGTYTLKNIDQSLVDNTTKYLNEQYTDQTGAYKWTIEATEGGYLLKKASGSYVTTAEEGTFHYHYMTNAADAASAIVWTLLSKSEYAAALTARKNAEAAAIATAAGRSETTEAALISALASDFGETDKTSSLTNASLASNADGWTAVSYNGQRRNQAGEDPDKYDVIRFNGGAEVWNYIGGAEQTVSSLPEGIYKVTVKSIWRLADATAATRAGNEANVTAWLYANDNYTQLKSWYEHQLANNAALHASTDDEYVNTLYVYVEDGQDLTIGMASPSWCGVPWMPFYDFTLTYYEPKATPAEKEALADAITAAEAKTLGFEDGEYAPYNNVDALTKLAAAKAINPETASGEAVVAATSTLNGATWTENDGAINAIYDGNFTNAPVADATGGVNGWSAAEGLRQLVKSNVEGSIVNTGMYVWGSNAITYGETFGYTMPLLPNAVYKLTYDRASWSGGSSSHTGITITDPSGTELGVATEDGYAGDWNTTDGTLLSRTIYFATTTAGNYTMTLSPWGNTVYTNMELYKTNDPLEFADGSVPSYVPGTYPSVKITRALTAGKWATAVYPFAVSGVDNIAVLNSYNAETGALGFTTVAVSTANEPFLMRSTAGTDEISLSNVEVAAAANAPQVQKEPLSLIGTYAAKTLEADESYKFYVLSNNAIHPSTGATINPYRAYIQVEQPAEQAARELTFFVDGETTGISSLNPSTKSEDKVVFNLNGQRVNKAQKGVYIINGKKAIVK